MGEFCLVGELGREEFDTNEAAPSSLLNNNGEYAYIEYCFNLWWLWIKFVQYIMGLRYAKFYLNRLICACPKLAGSLVSATICGTEQIPVQGTIEYFGLYYIWDFEVTGIHKMIF